MSNSDPMVCERHPDQPWPHDGCPGPGMPAQPSAEAPVWPVEYPEWSLDLLVAARLAGHSDNMDMGRVLAGAIYGRDESTVAFILGHGPDPLRPVAEAGLNLLRGIGDPT